MAYQVRLRLKDGVISDNSKMYNDATPARGDIIDVDTDTRRYGTVKARVEDVRCAHPVDFVSAVQDETVSA